MERKQRRNKISKSKCEEQQRDGDGGLKQISKQEDMRKCYESRQVGGIEKVEGKSKEISLKDKKIIIITNETNKEKSLMGINKGQGNKKQEKTYMNRKPRKIKSVQLYERFQEGIRRRSKKKLFQNVHEISNGTKNNTINLIERKMRTFYVTNIPWKTSQRKRKMY